jgi:hypothetical protein
VKGGKRPPTVTKGDGRCSGKKKENFFRPMVGLGF